MDWLDARIEVYPRLHVYHYAAYENSALKRLSGRHSTREGLLDQLLREHRLVDLYKVVRESIRASTPSYSIKDIEKFYRGARAGDVQTAGASIVYYERYLQTREQKLLRRHRALQRRRRALAAATARVAASAAPVRHALALMRSRVMSETATASQSPSGLPSAKLQAYLDAVEAVRAAVTRRPAPRTLRNGLRRIVRRA